MQRNSIITVAVAFCVIAVLAGYLVTGMSSSTGGASISAQAGVPTVEGAPTEAIEEVPSAIPTTEPVPTTKAVAVVPDAATAAPEAATAAPEAATAAPEAATAAPEAATAAPASPSFIEYTVQKGDELLALAKKFNVSVKDILDNNQIANPDSLVVGQVLRIPQ